MSPKRGHGCRACGTAAEVQHRIGRGAELEVEDGRDVGGPVSPGGTLSGVTHHRRLARAAALSTGCGRLPTRGQNLEGTGFRGRHLVARVRPPTVHVEDRRGPNLLGVEARGDALTGVGSGVGGRWMRARIPMYSFITGRTRWLSVRRGRSCYSPGTDVDSPPTTHERRVGVVGHSVGTCATGECPWLEQMRAGNRLS